MSAVIGILNKHAVALAADSAVTISGGGNRKILNTANKIFTISKFHPVGIMVYNSAEFMGTPWEIIIKMYREQLGNKSFNKIDDYRNDFIKYLRSRNFFSDNEDEKRALKNYFYSLINQLNNEAVAGNESEMAESLIYLTYLKRRITFAEESVGGPVDVALITKGDGFIWMKRKHYFDPKLNHHFFKGYLK